MGFQLSIIIIVFMLCAIATQSTSTYAGISWNVKRNLWQAEFYINGKVTKFYFDNKFEATKKSNQLCDKMGISPQNIELPNQKKDAKISQYKGVFWHKERGKWTTQLQVKGKELYGGSFKDELDAAKRVNRLCENFEIPLQNPEIGTIPNEQYEKKEKISKYKGVTWHKERKKWYVIIRPKGQRTQYGGGFENELDAVKRVNELCEELGIAPQNPAISGIPNQQNQKQEKISQYKGVFWHKERGKWTTRLQAQNKKLYGGSFNDELDAAKKANQLCEELGIRLLNPGIDTILNEQYEKREKTSQYKGVTWHKQRKKWYVSMRPKGQTTKHGGYFQDELDAAKRANQLCEELGISLQNPEISAVPNQQFQRIKTSQYKGVTWHREKRKWQAHLLLKGQKPKYGGTFITELDAVKRVNQLCEELRIPLQNPEISAILNQPYEKKENASQYTGVCWDTKSRKWRVQLSLRGKQKCGGYFREELDAANKVNQLCEELGIPLRNPEISTILNEQCEVPVLEKTLHDYDAIQEEFEDLIGFLTRANYPTALNIRKAIFTSIRHVEQTKMLEINLQTKNGESALSIAAKHGFSNVVKFLISKGANKEHFTNEHHTPLSLAVSQNHLKVVQVLFEDWISPNSYQKSYLHLSPIFQVKSREIAQLLIDNDAVTHDIYNDKDQSPLTVACQHGYLDVVECFLDDGLDINHLDSDNKTPLFYALQNKHHDVAKLLISKGAENRLLID